MWVLNLCLPAGFLMLLLGVIGMLDLSRSTETDQLASGETMRDTNEVVVAPRRESSLCRFTITMVVLLTCAVLGCFLLGCLSTRASTFIVGFMLAMTCDPILPGN